MYYSIKKVISSNKKIKLKLIFYFRLSDFGLSKDHFKKNTKTFCGSPAYMPPEIIGRKTYSKTVDWYMLGIFAYELMNGLPAYYNKNKKVFF